MFSLAFGRLKTKVFGNKDIYTRPKIKVYRTIIFPTLLYGSQTWATYSRHLKSFKAYHQRTLCKILNIKWNDEHTHNSILNESGIPSMEAFIINNQLCWAGHVLRMEDSRLPKQIMFAVLSNGKRKHNGQRKCFKDNLKHSIKQCYINPDSWETCAQSQ